MIAATLKDGWRVRTPRSIRSILSLTSYHAATGPRSNSQNSEARQLEKRARKLLERHPHFRGKMRWVSCRYVDQSLRLVGCVPSYYLKQLAQIFLRSTARVFDDKLIVDSNTLEFPKRFLGQLFEIKCRHAANEAQTLIDIPTGNPPVFATKMGRTFKQFFGPLFRKGALKPYLKNLKRLQNILGYLNDVAAAERLHAMDFSDSRIADVLQQASGFVIGWHTARAASAWRRAQSAWYELDKSDPFWRDP